MPVPETWRTRHPVDESESRKHAALPCQVPLRLLAALDRVVDRTG